MKKLSFLFLFSIILGGGSLVAQCTASYTFTTSSLTATFTDASTNAFSYSWDFGDSTFSTLQNPSHTYSTGGTYIACLTISDTSRCSSTFCDTIVVSGSAPGCNTTFTFNDSIIHASCNYLNGSIDILNLSGGVAPYTYSWSSGGTGSFISSLGAGNYTLTITDANGCDTVSSYTVNSIVNPNYTYVDSNGVVSFTSTTGGSGATYSWNFGDSTFSSLANPSHTYSQSGSYIVCLTVTDSNRVACTYCDTVVVNISTSSPCTAGFTFTVDTSKTATFTNTSSPLSGSTFSWNFGDGDTASGTNTTHTYTMAGTYIVTLSMEDSSLNTCSYTDTVVISSNTPSRCNASYSISLDTTRTFSVLLTNLSTNLASHTYFWDFGDSSTSTVRNPTHQFSSFGAYYVCLTISDSLLNCTSTFCDTVAMDSSGNLKSGGFGVVVEDPVIVGIEESNQLILKELNIFPNPASSIISVDMTELDQPLNIQLLDLSGKVVFEKRQNLPGRVNTFDISGLNNGFYFMLLDDGNSRRVQKVIKS